MTVQDSLYVGILLNIKNYSVKLSMRSFEIYYKTICIMS